MYFLIVSLTKINGKNKYVFNVLLLYTKLRLQRKYNLYFCAIYYVYIAFEGQQMFVHLKYIYLKKVNVLIFSQRFILDLLTPHIKILLYCLEITTCFWVSRV